MVTLHEVITFLVSMQVSISHLQTHLFFFLIIRRPPKSTLFPNTTLFRSVKAQRSSSTQGGARRSRNFSVSRRATTQPASRIGDTLALFSMAISVLLHSEKALYHSRSEEHTSELQSQSNIVCRLLLEKIQL